MRPWAQMPASASGSPANPGGGAGKPKVINSCPKRSTEGIIGSGRASPGASSRRSRHAMSPRPVSRSIGTQHSELTRPRRMGQPRRSGKSSSSSADGGSVGVPLRLSASATTWAHVRTFPGAARKPAPIPIWPRRIRTTAASSAALTSLRPLPCERDGEVALGTGLCNDGSELPAQLEPELHLHLIWTCLTEPFDERLCSGHRPVERLFETLAGLCDNLPWTCRTHDAAADRVVDLDCDGTASLHPELDYVAH